MDTKIDKRMGKKTRREIDSLASYRNVKKPKPNDEDAQNNLENLLWKISGKSPKVLEELQKKRETDAIVKAITRIENSTHDIQINVPNALDEIYGSAEHYADNM